MPLEIIIYSINKIRSVTLTLKDLPSAALWASHTQTMRFSTASSQNLLPRSIFTIKERKNILRPFYCFAYMEWNNTGANFLFTCPCLSQARLQQSCCISCNRKWESTRGCNFSVQHYGVFGTSNSKCMLELGPGFRCIYNFFRYAGDLPKLGHHQVSLVRQPAWVLNSLCPKKSPWVRGL